MILLDSPFIIVTIGASVFLAIGYVFGHNIGFKDGKEEAYRHIAEQEKRAKAEVMWKNLMKIGGLKHE